MAAVGPQSLPLDFEREYLLLAQTPSTAKAWNIQHVLENDRACEPVGEIAQSFNAWIEKLWEQNGDGRRIATRLQIQLAVLVALAKHPFRFLEDSKGLSAALATCLAQGSGIPAFEDACARAQEAWDRGEFPSDQLPLMAAEQEALICICAAQEVLNQQALIEMGRVLAYLASHAAEVFIAPVSVKFIDAAPLTPAQELFFAACGGACELEEVPADTEPLQRMGDLDVRTALASGAYAQPQLVLNIIHDMLVEHPDSHVVVTCKDPAKLFESMASALQQAGIACAVQAMVSFAKTDFGCAYLLMQSLDERRLPLDSAVLTDVLLSPLCGMKPEAVWQFNKTVRGDRLMTAAEARALLQGKSRILDCMLAGDFLDPAFEVRFNQLLGQGVSPAYVREQQSAYYALRDALAMAEQFGITGGEVQDALLDRMSFSASRVLEPVEDVVRLDLTGQSAQTDLPLQPAMAPTATEPGHLPQVRIMNQYAARALMLGSVDLLIVCDLTTEQYPLRDDRSAARSLLQALGIGDSASLLARERAYFRELLRVASERVVLERCSNDAKADPLYPSAMLEEFLAAYADMPDGIPQTYALGEQDLIHDAKPVYPGLEASTEELPIEARDHVGVHLDMVAPHTARQQHPELPRLSPSQIELYLDCPHKWFVMNRLGTDTLDEDLGPAQRGSFLHTVFQQFYTAFGQKVTPANIEEARQLMFGTDGNGGIFANLVAAQYEKDAEGRPLQNRFVPLPHTPEMLEFETLKERVNDWLVFETTFLPAYHPIAFEQRFEGIEFEGCELAGVIDRIDQDDEGHLVVIDYKGALKEEHGAVKDDLFLENGKIQALLYAMLIDKLDAIPASTEDVVGSLYVSYNRGNPVMGAYRARFLGPRAIPSISSDKRCRLSDDTPLSYERLLDYTRQRIAEAVEGIKQGRIAPAPHGKNTCAYCPVLTCEMRGQ